MFQAGINPDPVMALLLDQNVQVERAKHHDDAQNRQPQGNFVGDHVGGGAQPAEEGIFVVAGPAADDDAVDRQGQHRQDEENADVQAGDLKGILIGDLVLAAVANPHGICRRVGIPGAVAVAPPPGRN